MAATIPFEIFTAVPGTVHAWNAPNFDCSIPSGPWHDEPTKIQWVDATTGLPCLIVRNRLGALCGYAGVDPTHPLHKRDYDSLYPDIDVNVHGGLTFSDSCAHSKDESQGICHIPEPGSSDDIWWFGFDCAHCGDLVPGMLRHFKSESEEDYRDVAYVADEVTRLAAQLAHLQEAA